MKTKKTNLNIYYIYILYDNSSGLIHLHGIINIRYLFIIYHLSLCKWI